MRSPTEGINAVPERRMSHEAAALGECRRQAYFSAETQRGYYANEQRKPDLSSAKIQSQAAAVKSWETYKEWNAASVTVDVEGTVSIEMGEEKLSEKSASSSLAPGMSKARM